MAFCKNCGTEIQEGKILCENCTPRPVIQQKPNTVHPKSNTLTWILAGVLFVATIMIAIFGIKAGKSFDYASKQLTIASANMDIKSVGGESIAEAFYQANGTQAWGFSNFSEAMGCTVYTITVFMCSITLFFGIKTVLKLKK